MPSWKTLEARERLLAATVASLDIKSLNYRRIATYFGEGTTYDSIEGQFRTIRKLAQQLRDAVNDGSHPEAPERGTATPKRANPGPARAKKERAPASPSAARAAPAAARQRDGVLGGRVTKSKSITPNNASGIVRGFKQEVESSAESVAPSPADSYDLPPALGGPPVFMDSFGMSFESASAADFGAGLDGVFEWEV